ncbi:MAG: MMPL family transporter [Myxococcota bacterium]|nr:MMPL family transporter [Myxococcota bacterium]
MPRSPEQLSRRYVAWVKRNAIAIVGVHLALVAGAVYLILNHLPLRADFSNLLPQDSQSVVDLRRLEARVKAGDTVLVLVQAPDAPQRAAVASELVERVRAVSSDLVEYVEADDAELRAFLAARKELFIPLEELQRAREALAAYIEQAKLKANPLYVDLEDPDPEAEARSKQQLDDLRARRREAEARLAVPGNVTADGTLTSIQVRTPFRATDAGRGAALLEALQDIRTELVAKYPAVKIGFTGGVVTSVAEHGAISQGMLISGLVTGVLVALVLALYFRSATLLVLLLCTLGVATTISFGIAAITVGHLNAATAFLGAIIAGNGVNYGILLIARYLEERRHHDVDVAMGKAIVGTMRPTAIASLGASIAYGSLAATSFRGFADFAVIGAIGMMVCWTVSYILLPALVVRWGHHTRIFQGDPVVGTTLVRLIGFRSSKAVVAVGILITAIAGVIVTRYIAADPFEYDIRQLRSKGDDALLAREWMDLSDKHFGRGITGRTYIATDRLEQVPKVVDALRALDAHQPPAKQTIGSISSYLDVVPPEQEAKLAVIDEIRAMLDDDALEALDDRQRAELLELRPRDGLTAFGATELPPVLQQRLTERDGRVGYFVSIRPSDHLDEWNGKDLIRFANAVRRLELAGDETVTTSGSSVIFADIIESIERDGPLVTGVAILGLVIMVVLLVGRNRRAVAVLIGTGSGTLLMVAICALLGIKVNFLDFVALPITLGLGIDYAINVAHRHDHDEIPDPIATLRTSGSAVFLCAITTIIGYGSLLVSDNLAIRAFGLASLIGEITCLLTALVLVPAILVVGHRKARQASSLA